MRGVTVALDGHGAEQGYDVLAEGARRAAADGIGLRVFGPAVEVAFDSSLQVKSCPLPLDRIANAHVLIE